MEAIHTIYLPLSQGLWATVDSDVGWDIIGYKWHVRRRHKTDPNIYAARHGITEKGGHTNVLLHLCVLPKKEGVLVDHRNRDGLDNRRKNLRYATKSQNLMNARKRKQTSSRFKGVWWHKQAQCWSAEITFRKKKYHLGLFSEEKKAAEAYDTAAKQYFGEYAKTNF